MYKSKMQAPLRSVTPWMEFYKPEGQFLPLFKSGFRRITNLWTQWEDPTWQ